MIKITGTKEIGHAKSRSVRAYLNIGNVSFFSHENRYNHTENLIGFDKGR